ncbi:MAG TPA: MFS transporter, partial [Dehalococcoidales bacterium]|nr:MFS transporter [Dehalococcoidales bacterium]
MITLSRYLTKNIFRRFPRGVWLMMGLDTLLGAASSLVFPFLALYLHNERGLPMSLVGTVFLIGGLVTGGTNLVGGMLSDRFGRRRLMLGVISATIFMYGVLA